MSKGPWPALWSTLSIHRQTCTTTSRWLHCRAPRYRSPITWVRFVCRWNRRLTPCLRATDGPVVRYPDGVRRASTCRGTLACSRRYRCRCGIANGASRVWEPQDSVLRSSCTQDSCARAARRTKTRARWVKNTPFRNHIRIIRIVYQLINSRSLSFRTPFRKYNWFFEFWWKLFLGINNVLMYYSRYIFSRYICIDLIYRY